MSQVQNPAAKPESTPPAPPASMQGTLERHPDGGFMIRIPDVQAANLRENANGNPYVTVQCEGQPTLAVAGHPFQFRRAVLNLSLAPLKPGQSQGKAKSTPKAYTLK